MLRANLEVCVKTAEQEKEWGSGGQLSSVTIYPIPLPFLNMILHPNHLGEVAAKLALTALRTVI